MQADVIPNHLRQTFYLKTGSSCDTLQLRRHQNGNEEQVLCERLGDALTRCESDLK